MNLAQKKQLDRLQAELADELRLRSKGHYWNEPSAREMDIRSEIDELRRFAAEADRVRERQRQHMEANMWLRDRQHQWQEIGLEPGGHLSWDEANFFRIPDYLQPR